MVGAGQGAGGGEPDELQQPQSSGHPTRANVHPGRHPSCSAETSQQFMNFFRERNGSGIFCLKENFRDV